MPETFNCPTLHLSFNINVINAKRRMSLKKYTEVGTGANEIDTRTAASEQLDNEIQDALQKHSTEGETQVSRLACR